MTGKQLRNSILQWAIQGKLVPQDPNDEPASVLLERIRAEKARLVKEKKIKRDKNESIIYRGEDNSYYEKLLATGEAKCIDKEIPFEIPQGWAWCRLGDIFNHTSGKQQSSSNKGGGTPQKFITTSNLYWGRFVLDNVKIMNFTEEEIKNFSATKGDLLVCEGGAGYGRSAIWNEDYDICLQNHIHRLRPYVSGICEYVFYYIYLLKESNNLASVGTAMPGLSANRLKSLLLPFPPLSEQKRIVAKLGELLPKAHKYSKVQSQLNELNTTIKVLIKKSVLQEAIQGKLVPQITEEGSAQELLELIEKGKQKLIKEGKLKKSALAASRIFRGDDNKYRQNIDGEEVIIDDNLPFEIPDTWRWVTLGELILDSTGLSYKKEFLADKSGLMVRVLRGGNIEEGQILFKTDDVMISAKYVPDNLYLKQGTFISPAVSSLEKIGKTALIERDYDYVVAGGFVLLLSPLYSDVNLGKYLYYFFQTGYYHNYCRTATKKSGQAFYNLSRPKLKECYVPIPPKEELPRILSRIDQVLSSIMSR